MKSPDARVREIIAHQAGDWFVAHRAGSMSASDRSAFKAWLAASPIHVEEYLGVALLARRLPVAANDPELPLEVILERVRQENIGKLARLGSGRIHRGPVVFTARFARSWQWVATAATVLLSVTTLLWWNADRALTERYSTRHGETKVWRLSDATVLHLNTDTALTVRYRRAERLIEIDRGEALFEVAHETARPFRVVAGTANIVAVGTTFDVYREPHATLVTVVQGRVRVASIDVGGEPVRVSSGEQVRVTPGSRPASATRANVQGNTAWLHRKIVFDQEPLGVVVAELNRYAAVPFEVETPALRTLAISGTFDADDTESFVAFLRTLDGVTVEAMPTRIRIFSKDIDSQR